MTSQDTTPQITTYFKSLASPLPSSPSFHFHLTKLTQTLMIWVGTASPSPDPDSIPRPEDGELRLAGEWAAAWTAGKSQPVGTPIYRASATDLAVPMSQRLAKRYPNHQIFLSLSIPPTLTSSTASHPYAGRILLTMEKELSKWIAEVA